MKLSALLKHRFIWMGIAILWIVLYHSNLILPHIPIKFIKKIGYGGVDIFIFASGLGTYLSYTGDHDPLAFIKRRLKRLAPVFLPFIVIWTAYTLHYGEASIRSAIGNIFAIQGFTGLGNEFNWYITCLVVIYILTPYFSGIIENVKKTYQFFLLVTVLLLLTIPFWNSYNTIVIVTRLPIFVMGMYFAKLSKDENKNLPVKLIAVLMGAMLAGILLLKLLFAKCYDYLWLYGLYWYPFILITPGFCILISLIVNALYKYKIAKVFFSALDKIGSYSFEIYLVHILCLDVYQNHLLPAKILPDSDWSILLVLISVIPLCLLLRLCSKGCLKLADHIKFKSP